ncbi:hypothetical protein RF11_02543 [Thelohanellus kitauei]|uniref:Uncharacterized protein n=1 Tax=Thelohanellus kitauei TaxID=669202 RepID=A0A0C2MAX8_THEKT|nr:hypothetical protein RF11_02543 [Thelohanellus kitauei]
MSQIIDEKFNTNNYNILFNRTLKFSSNYMQIFSVSLHVSFENTLKEGRGTTSPEGQEATRALKNEKPLHGSGQSSTVDTTTTPPRPGLGLYGVWIRVPRPSLPGSNRPALRVY